MNGNSNGSQKLKRMELSFKGVSYSFTLNPEQYEIKLQNRMNSTYTKNGAYIELFGEGMREINISGTTGLKGTTKDINHGHNKIKELKSLIESNMSDVSDGRDVTDYLMFYNHTDGEGYVTVPQRFSIMRNVNQPLLYKFDLSLLAIRKAGDPAPSSSIQVVGNPFGVESESSSVVKDRDLIDKMNSGNSNFSEENQVLKNDADKEYNVPGVRRTTGETR